MIAAERLGVPHATVVVCGAGGFVRPEYVAPCVDEVRAEHGLPPDLELTAPRRRLVLTPFPARFRDPAFPLPDDAQPFRAFPSDAERGTRAGATSGRTRTVYFTLGTVFHVESGDLMERVLEGLREVPAQIVVTVGRERSPSELGPQPAHVRIERFVPQAEILPRCDAVVSHGGSGSVLGALAHGIPLVLLPIGADQPLNARALRSARRRPRARPADPHARAAARGRDARARGSGPPQRRAAGPERDRRDARSRSRGDIARAGRSALRGDGGHRRCSHRNAEPGCRSGTCDYETVSRRSRPLRAISPCLASSHPATAPVLRKSDATSAPRAPACYAAQSRGLFPVSRRIRCTPTLPCSTCTCAIGCRGLQVSMMLGR